MRTLALALLAPLALLATPACSKVIGIDGVTLRDAGDSPDSGPPPNTVIGRSYTRHLTAAGNMDVPSDLSAVVIQALIADPAQPSGYRVVAGAGKADGTFTITDVPDGAPYLLKLDTAYYATTFHDLDLRTEIPIRGVPAPNVLSALTVVSFDVQGMTPFVTGPEGTFSFIEIDSLNLGYQGSIVLPTNNVRSLTTTYNWDSGVNLAGGPQPLPEAARDDLTLLHLRNDVIPTPSGRKQRLTRVIDTFMPPGVTIGNGMETSVNGTWEAAGANRSINLSITRGAFDAGYDGNSQFSGMQAHLVAHPVRNDLGGAARVFSANLFDWSRTGSLSETLSFMYADPFPASWSRLLVISYERARHFRLPNTTGSLSIPTSNLNVAPYISGDPVTAPALQPPANIKVAGKDANPGGVAPFDGTAPVELTWNTVAAAGLYTVRVEHVFQNGTQTQSTTVARLSTTQSSIKIPAEIFSANQFFAFVVTAVKTPADYNAGDLLPNGTPHSFAGAVTGLFRLSDLCGNGTMDPGEQCDTGGESASCDLDCTTRVCGDGLRNAAAGEACDTVRDTSGCDSDCTLPVCGDSRVNLITEDCDDGNATDSGNGCSSGCRFNNVCGDGTRQVLIEACDPGGVGETAVCDSDCTTATCGDAHRNPAANEQCDDGNLDETDGCTTSCQLN